jgi:hypothetical protein
MMRKDSPHQPGSEGLNCPVCDDVYSKAGLPNHLRRHSRLAAKSVPMTASKRRSLAWWDGWKEGYRSAMTEARDHARKKFRRSKENHEP